ncbi:MAG: biosynthetic-type acetolactate synthase large subunit [Bacteroidales bacterium]|nr:biosynthetic-type acetolactate synthase large subunit [Bacteroidales bacterium]
MNYQNKENIRGAEAVILSLLNENVEHVFGYVGGAIMPVYDALYDYQDVLIHYLTRHEQGAIHAAQSYARVSGKVGVCFATSGPGATNLVTGLADAQLDSTPLVCITGQVDSRMLGTDAFQETDVIGVTMPVTKWSSQVTRAEEIPEAIAKAFYIAQSGRPGPVLIDITKDAQFGLFNFQYKACKRIRSYFPHPKLNIGLLDEALKMIDASQKPFLLIGHGVTISKAEKEVKAFVEKTKIPVASTLLGLSAFPSHHPLYMGMLGMHGNYAPNILTNECDLLIAIGMRFDDRVTGDVERYAKQAKIIHIDIDSAELNKNVFADIAIPADAKEALQYVLPKLKQKHTEDWLNQFAQLRVKEQTLIDAQLYPGKGKVSMGEVIRVVNEQSQTKPIVVTDVGQHQMMSGRYFEFNEGRSFVTSGGLGTMGFGLPASIGAKIASPEKGVVAVLGDGGFQMTIQELGTIFQYKIPVKILILNNNFLGMVRQWQQLFFEKRYSFTEMHNPDFLTIAKGYNIQSNKVFERSKLESAVKEMLASKGPYLLEVDVEMEENVFPMVPAGASVSEILLGNEELN